MAYGGVDKYYNPENKVVNDGDTAFADDVNNINYAVDAAFAFVADDLDALSAKVEVVVDQAEAWADTPQGTIPSVLTPGQYSSKAYAIESKEYAIQTEGVPIHKADGTTQLIDSAFVSATKAAASQADALVSKNAAALSESNAFTYSREAYNEQVAAADSACMASDFAEAAGDSADLAALSAANLPNATTGGPNVALTTNAAGDAFDYTPITSLSKSLMATSTADAHKTLLGLENVDNTSDLDKPVSIAQAAAIDAAVPVGAIVAFIGGYFGTSGNGSFTNVIGNTVANVNTLLNPKGWYVCDGTALNLPTSPIFNGVGRYLPNLTDSRFIMGSTSAGGVGGSNTTEHTHTIAHTHPMGHTHWVNAHTLAEWQMPYHSHTEHDEVWANVSGSSYRTARTSGNWCNSIRHGGRAHIATYPTGSSGAHDHGNTGGASTSTTSAASAASSGTASLENRPKFISCLYLMKVV